MTKPNYFIGLTAWYYRNIKYKDLVVHFHPDYGCRFPLFELVALHNGIEAYYLGNDMFLPKKSREQFFDENVNMSNIPKIAIL